MSDGPASVRGPSWDERSTAVLLPSATALAATWDDPLVERLGSLLALEARRKGVHVVLAPNLNLHRSPLGGRHFECFSEDPELTGRIGAALVRGIQAHVVAATAKHYVANDSETDRLTVNVRVGARALREVYLAPFEAAVAADVRFVMAGYNAVDGATMTANPLLSDPLRSEWGFDGVVVSDWGAARTTLDTARAGLDLVMPGPDGPGAGAGARRGGGTPRAARRRRQGAASAEAGRLARRAGPAPPRTPAYWFGHGLGYTTWAYEELTGPPAVRAGESFTVRVRLRNTVRAPAARSSRYIWPGPAPHWNTPSGGSRDTRWSTPARERR